MMKNIFKSKFVKVVAVIVVAIVITLFLINKDIISIGGSFSSIGQTHRQLVGDSLNCTIVLDKNLNTAKPGLRFATNLIRKFAEDHHCIVKISVDQKDIERWDDLIVGKTDMLIVNSKDSIPVPYSDYIEQSVPIEGDYVCVVKLGNSAVLSSVNYWLSRYKQSSEYQKTWANTKKLLSRVKYGFGQTRYSISEYDNLVKKYARQIGWDWRLLCALIYQESKFNQGVVSRRGAIGLMQVMESTAARLGFYDIYNPEENIQVGVKELVRLKNRYTKMGADSTNVIKLTMAAYNCGDGKIAQCMKQAQADGLNHLLWENINNYVSRETSTHVDVIMRQYDLYCLSVVE